MKLGAFSISLAVKDIAASKAFYEQLGFEKFHGDESQNWVMLRNGETVIGLFQDMFPSNVLTFNPGWDQKAEILDSFDDIRVIQASLKEAGVNLDREADPCETGPAHIALTDPDGNSILIDQHV
ncbi:VOC family protein [Pontixanthobacter aestiaquae]|uniref:VOC family protein n=1 Tax=Pontixanthobacter aestiaquae TaxID=1509367 RepID=A0A844Z9C0_9SPHN|nr:VOC family protein [Pontixanthobacter aestiaquae]MDN3646523.1 VOC family protein [Pontixanthobacter aestiaquae]MXO82489.1 VOC family protein [Pontixanthobacter aestiaquae]